ncbi:class I SAM-dependent methyltransferase [Thermodesulfobacteriota bacterium]
MNNTTDYLMENLEEAIRLEVKTDAQAVLKQAKWCGLKPRQRVLDAGCGSGLVTSILYTMIQPSGQILGLDSSKERIQYAKKKYSSTPSIDFQQHNLIDPLDGFEKFDIIWVRFLLEYYRKESRDIVENLSRCLKPGGYLCLLDLDHNSLNHFELPSNMTRILHRIIDKLEHEFNFDPYVGRKLYAYLYDLGFENIQMDLTAHHLIYGEIKGSDRFNWFKKVEVATEKTLDLFEDYPGNHEAFFRDFEAFFMNPRRFTYTPLIMCKGAKPF